jgi:hypothetical protein
MLGISLRREEEQSSQNTDLKVYGWQGEIPVRGMTKNKKVGGRIEQATNVSLLLSPSYF